MEKIRVLFLCIHNTSRSQMAEAFLRSLAGDEFEAYSAGLEPREIHPLAITVMEERGIDMSATALEAALRVHGQGPLRLPHHRL